MGPLARLETGTSFFPLNLSLLINRDVCDRLAALGSASWHPDYADYARFWPGCGYLGFGRERVSTPGCVFVGFFAPADNSTSVATSFAVNVCFSVGCLEQDQDTEGLADTYRWTEYLSWMV